jgi:hypothetical protein
MGRINVTNVTWADHGLLISGDAVTSVMSPHVMKVTSTGWAR